MKVGFIGLGNVGGKLAGSLLRNKFDLTVRDLDQNLTKHFTDLGAKVAHISINNIPPPKSNRLGWSIPVK